MFEGISIVYWHQRPAWFFRRTQFFHLGSPMGHRTYPHVAIVVARITIIPHGPLDHHPPWTIPHCSLPSVPKMFVSKPRLWCSLSRNGKHFKLYLTATLFVGITLALDTGAFCRSALAVLSLNFWDLDKMFDNTDVEWRNWSWISFLKNNSFLSKSSILHPCTNDYRTFAVLGNFKFKWEFMIVNDDKLYSGNWNWNNAWNTSYQKHFQIISKSYQKHFQNFKFLSNFQIISKAFLNHFPNITKAYPDIFLSMSNLWYFT